MRKCNLIILFILIVLSGCAGVSQPKSNGYVAASRPDKVVLLMETADEKKYCIGQPVDALKVLGMDYLRSKEQAEEKVYFNDAIRKLSIERDLYRELFKKVALEIRAAGVEVVERESDLANSMVVVEEMRSSGWRWAFRINKPSICYSSENMISDYRPTIFFELVPYDAKTDSLFLPIPLHFISRNNDYGFATSRSVVENIPVAFRGMEDALNDAAKMAPKAIFNN